MQITRRDFINAACSAALIATAGGLTASFGQRSLSDELFPIPVEAYSEPLFSMTARQLTAFVGQSFTASFEGRRATSLVLTEVNALARPQNTIAGYYGECFSLIFSNERRPLEPGTYLMAARGLAPFSALLAPVNLERTRYEILVNHVTR